MLRVIIAERKLNGYFIYNIFHRSFLKIEDKQEENITVSLSDTHLIHIFLDLFDNSSNDISFSNLQIVLYSLLTVNSLKIMIKTILVLLFISNFQR